MRQVAERKAQLRFEPVDISSKFNDNLALVHTHKYLSPRSPYCSLQISIDLFHTWENYGQTETTPCKPLDLEFPKEATRRNGLLVTEPGVPFRSSAEGKNVVFVSQWDNFPKQVNIPIGRTAGHAYLLMASVTNPMQSGVVNGRVVFHLVGGQEVTLELQNPRNLSWCVTNYEYAYGPLFVVEPKVQLGPHVFATMYSVPLGDRRQVEVESVGLEAVCNESVIGLMALTLLPSG